MSCVLTSPLLITIDIPLALRVTVSGENLSCRLFPNKSSNWWASSLARCLLNGEDSYPLSRMICEICIHLFMSPDLLPLML